MRHIKAVNLGMNKYCGPAVLSILTGRNTDECAKVIRSVNGQYEVAGVHLTHLLQAAHKMGFNALNRDSSGSLYRTLTMMAHEDGIYIMTVPGHFVVIEVNDKEIFFCDNHTKEPMRAASSARLMQPVLTCHKVEKRPDYVEPEPLKLLSSEILIEFVGDSIEVYKQHTYNYAENNRKERLGYIQFNSLEEVQTFAAKLGFALRGSMQ